ncbi:MAG TPA: MSMEG_0565 family glycosyltransferase [Candidatus Dormibacteraeota bacterium]|nr:MSMEG_0565 family glycosyltransferase [Candidatus Dormibacteraeota bacterium]
MSGSAPGLPRVALVTYSTKPRGGVVHTLSLGEELHRLGYPAFVIALGDPDKGFFRPVSVPCDFIPPPPEAPTLVERVEATIAALTAGLRSLVPGRFDVLHVQDCLAARAATQLRAEGVPIRVIRTVHHVDDFTTQSLIDCQERSVVDPDHLLVVSDYWRRRLADDYGVQATVVVNGVDTRRFARPPGFDCRPFRARTGTSGRFLFLAVGGLEPRKGSIYLIEALVRIRDTVTPRPMVAVVGEHSFQDHSSYTSAVLARAEELGLKRGEDLLLLGTVPDEAMAEWYWSADAFAFPSVKEGWGLAVLEAMAAGLPVITSDIPVFKEYLHADEEVCMVRAADPVALADAMASMVTNADLRLRLAGEGPIVAARYTWETCARQHLEFYRSLGGGRATTWEAGRAQD